jgi:hypothetical protein
MVSIEGVLWNGAAPFAFSYATTKDLDMKTIAMLTGAALLVAGSAYAQDTTIIHKDGVGSDRTVVRQDAPASTTVEKRTTTESVGCSSKSVTKTDEVGDKVTKTKTDC